eukprot:1178361-Prymnesium_polylepis.2
MRKPKQTRYTDTDTGASGDQGITRNTSQSEGLVGDGFGAIVIRGLLFSHNLGASEQGHFHGRALLARVKRCEGQRQILHHTSTGVKRQGKRVWALSNIEEVAVARGAVDERRTVGGTGVAYLLSLDKEYKPGGVFIDDPKGMFILRWYKEVDTNGKELSGSACTRIRRARDTS